MRYYAKMGTWYFALFTSALYLSLACASPAAHMLGATVMGIFWQQLAGLGHDLGHSGVSHMFYTDMCVGSTIGNALMGISTGTRRERRRRWAKSLLNSPLTPLSARPRDLSPRLVEALAQHAPRRVQFG